MSDADRLEEFRAWTLSTAMPRSPYGQELLIWALGEIERLRGETERRAPEAGADR